MAAVWDLYALTGGELVDKETLEKRFEICKTCPYFNGRGCDLCGCCANKRKTLFNKLAYPTQSCPDGRWVNIQ